jgi:hypothetical protein
MGLQPGRIDKAHPSDFKEMERLSSSRVQRTISRFFPGEKTRFLFYRRCKNRELTGKNREFSSKKRPRSSNIKRLESI